MEEAYRSAPDSKKAELRTKIQTQRLAVKQAQRDNKLAVQTLKRASSKNNQTGAFVGGEATLGFATTKPNYPVGAGYVEIKDGFALAADFDIKGGYKFYFTDKLGIRAHAGLGYGTRLSALSVVNGADTTYTTSGFKVGLGGDLLFSPGGSFGLFAGAGVDIHSWNYDIRVTDISTDSYSMSGTTAIPKIQVGMRFGGFEIAGVYNLSAIQPSNRNDIVNMTYGNTMGVKLGYYYSF